MKRYYQNLFRVEVTQRVKNRSTELIHLNRPESPNFEYLLHELLISPRNTLFRAFRVLKKTFLTYCRMLHHYRMR